MTLPIRAPAPPPKDLPRDEIIDLAREALAKSGPRGAVYFKFTCPACGQRCTFDTPGTLYERGECFECGVETAIEKAGFLLVLTMGTPPDEITDVVDRAASGKGAEDRLTRILNEGELP